MEIQCYLIQMKISNYPDSLGKHNRLADNNIFRKTVQFNTYEDYLHQDACHHIYNHRRRPIKSKPLVTNIKEEQIINPAYPISSTIEYYPIQRTIIDYQDRQVKQLTPKKKIITEYIEKKQVEVVPREVVVKDYYAVEHVRAYLKEIVPEVKIEYTTVPKIIKKEEVIPREKQIVYYPSNMTNLEQIRREAQHHLSKNGVIIRPDAEYRPAVTKPVTETETVKGSPIQSSKEKEDHAISKVAYGSPLSPSLAKQTSLKYYRLPRPSKNHFVASRSLGKNTKDEIPIYKKEKYSERISNDEGSKSRQTTDYSFAERDHQKVMSSSFGRSH